MADLAIGIEGELTRHFDFEEEELFSYLSAAGDEAIGAHLTGEHAVIRPLGAALVKLIGEIRAQGFDAARWNEFRQLGQELSERLVAARPEGRNGAAADARRNDGRRKSKRSSMKNTSKPREGTWRANSQP